MLDGDPMAAARTRADAAFDLFRVLDAPFYTFHDRDITPGELKLEQIAAQAEVKNLKPEPRSGKQEMLENLVARNLF
jgi:xylose isomerase